MDNKLELGRITKNITVDDETFIPMVRLFNMAMNDIYGPTAAEDYEILDILNHNDQDEEFGLIVMYCDSRMGFTLNLQHGYKEFAISSDGSKLNMDQLQLFDKLREWRFQL